MVLSGLLKSLTVEMTASAPSFTDNCLKVQMECFMLVFQDELHSGSFVVKSSSDTLVIHNGLRLFGISVVHCC